MNVQNANLNIRIPFKLRDKFLETAKKNGLTYSVVLRTMILEYIRLDGKLDMFHASLQQKD